MANGDIQSVFINSEGWNADVSIEGFGATVSMTNGLGANGDPTTGTPRVVFTVTSLGFDDTGAPTTIARTVYGTKILRQPYPNQALLQVTPTGPDSVIRFALSDYIYTKDNAGGGNSGVAVTCTLLAGAFTDSIVGASLAATNVVCANFSSASYPRVVGNWSWPGWSKLGSVEKFSVLAFNRFSMFGRPCRCVKITATDTSGHTATGMATEMTVDVTRGDVQPSPEWVVTLDLGAANFTQGNVVTLNFQAYPWVGDSASVLDTTDAGATAQPTPLYGPATYVYDGAGTYAQSVAVVDPVGGNDGTGTVTTNYLTALPYATLKGARDALRVYNNSNYTRDNPGGSIIYMRTGNHAWCGGTVSAGASTLETWLTLMGYPGDAKSGIILASQSGSKSLGGKTKISGITITVQTAGGVIDPNSASSYLWVDDCALNLPINNQPTFYRIGICYATRNQITSFTDGFKAFSTVLTTWAIVRANNCVSCGGSQAYCLIGNKNLGGISDTVSTPGPTLRNQVVAYNWWTFNVISSTPVTIRQSSLTETHGVAFIQNMLELRQNAAPALVQIAADSTTQTPVDNVMVWHNTMVGGRFNGPYNSLGSAAAYRRQWSLKGNIYDDYNIKEDTFPPSDGGRIGNWAELYGVGDTGELNCRTNGIGAGGAFPRMFNGLSVIWPSSGQGPNYARFKNLQAWNGVTAGAGGGDYHPGVGSPALGLTLERVLPVDLGGVTRPVGRQVAGAYYADNAKVSADAY